MENPVKWMRSDCLLKLVCAPSQAFAFRSMGFHLRILSGKASSLSWGIQSFSQWLWRTHVERERTQTHTRNHKCGYTSRHGIFITFFSFVQPLSVYWNPFGKFVRTQSFADLLASIRCSVVHVWSCVRVCVAVRLVTARGLVSVYARASYCVRLVCKWKKQATNEYVMIITTGISTQSTHSLHISTPTKKTAYSKPIFFRSVVSATKTKKSVFQRRNNEKYTHNNNINYDKCNTSQFNFIEKFMFSISILSHNVHFPRVNCYLYSCLYRFYIYRLLFITCVCNSVQYRNMVLIKHQCEFNTSSFVLIIKSE